MHTKIRYWLHTGPWVVFIAGMIAGLYLQFHFHKIIDIDTVSYINVAELYAAGKFELAINGYWSPLYCWLLAIIIKLHIPALEACYCINMVAAAVCFYFIKKTGGRYIKNPMVYALFQLYAVITLLSYGMSYLTPDLMGTAFMLWFLTLLWPEGIHTPSRRPVLAGIAGALAFLSKSYNFLFINLLFLLLLVMAIRAAIKRKEQTYRVLGRSYLVFLAVSLIWIIPLSIHEGAPVFSTAGGYSHGLISPAMPMHPVLNRIVPPPFEEAHTGWFNPSHQLDSCSWSSFENRQNVLHQLRLIRKNVIGWYKIIDNRYINALLLITCVLLLALDEQKRLAPVFRQAMPWLLVLVIYPLGYLPFFIQERYLYIEVLLFYLLLFYVFQEAMALFEGRRRLYFISLALVALFSLKATRLEWFVQQKALEYRYYRSINMALPRLQMLKGKRIVSDFISYAPATQYCYELHAKLYGPWTPAQQSKVWQYQVEYLLSAEPRPEAYLQLQDSIQLETQMLYVYRFINPPSRLPNTE